jgi:hypothetical protein
VPGLGSRVHGGGTATAQSRAVCVVGKTALTPRLADVGFRILGAVPVAQVYPWLPHSQRLLAKTPANNQRTLRRVPAAAGVFQWSIISIAGPCNGWCCGYIPVSSVGLARTRPTSCKDSRGSTCRVIMHGLHNGPVSPS